MGCYKSPERFLDELASIDTDGVMFPVVAYCDDDFTGRRRNRCHLVLVMAEKCADLDGKEILRYRVFMDHWLWGNSNSRIQIKAMIRIVEKKLDRPVPLYRVNGKDFLRLKKRLMVPRAIMEQERLWDVSLEDFSLSPEESAVSKESSELPLVLKYIEEFRLNQ